MLMDDWLDGSCHFGILDSSKLKINGWDWQGLCDGTSKVFSSHNGYVCRYLWIIFSMSRDENEEDSASFIWILWITSNFRRFKVSDTEYLHQISTVSSNSSQDNPSFVDSTKGTCQRRERLIPDNQNENLRKFRNAKVHNLTPHHHIPTKLSTKNPTPHKTPHRLHIKNISNPPPPLRRRSRATHPLLSAPTKMHLTLPKPKSNQHKKATRHNCTHQIP